MGFSRSAVCLALSACLGVAAGAQPLSLADFDDDGIVDGADLDLLRQHLGTQERRFDLDGDGRVGMGDLFAFADVAPTRLHRPAEPLPYSVRASQTEVFLALGDMDVRLRHGAPHGISSLKLRGQWEDFAHPTLTLADWEWLIYDAPVRQETRHKLLDAQWAAPHVTRRRDGVDVVYRRDLADGVQAEAAFHFPASGQAFRVDYGVHNGTERSLTGLYLMVGLPGFSNHGAVTQVASAQEQRRPRWPERTFLGEAFERDLSDYLLLKHEARSGASEGLKGSLELTDPSGTYRLASYFLSGPTVRRVYSAHTNKPRYLTSHLYVTLRDLPPGRSAHVSVHHVLSRDEERR
jgi:hypothetical protein